ncbi:MAG: hypothetical protein OJF49_001423 [Ktedonobacterales bacterium]|nr:MAG: hypothetical protein OJF49_001423 [Ktedonobacterales bacterium]
MGIHLFCLYVSIGNYHRVVGIERELVAARCKGYNLLAAR